MSERVYYRAERPSDAVEILQTKKLPLRKIGDDVGFFATRDYSSAYEWGLQLSYELGWDFFVVIEFSVPAGSVEREEEDPVALYVPPGVDSVFVVVKTQDVDYLPLSEVEIVCPENEGELIEQVEDILVHGARGGWMESEWVTDDDLRVLRDIDYRKYRTFLMVRNLRGEFERLMKVSGRSLDVGWWERLDGKLRELEGKFSDEGKDEFLKEFKPLVERLIFLLRRRLRGC